MISVIVPVRNQREILEICLVALRQQRHCLPFEIVVADDGSTDGTLELARKHGVKIAWEPGQGIWAARNVGVALAGGSYLWFLSPEVILPSTTLREAQEVVQERPNCLIAGSCDPLPPLRITPMDVISRFDRLAGAAEPSEAPCGFDNMIVPLRGSILAGRIGPEFVSNAQKVGFSMVFSRKIGGLRVRRR